MLSGDTLVGVLPSIAPAASDTVFYESQSSPLESPFAFGDSNAGDPNGPSFLEYDPSEKLDDLFSGLSDGDPFDSVFDDHTSEDPTGQTTEQVIDDDTTAVLKTGLRKLVSFSRVLEKMNGFAEPLPLVEKETFGSLLRPHDILDTRLTVPVFDYFSDATDPTVKGLKATLEEIPSTDDLDVAVEELTAGYDAVSGELRFAMTYEATRKGEVRLSSEAPKIGFEGNQKTDYTAELSLAFAFGTTRRSGPVDFFVEVQDLTADLHIESDDVEGMVRTETLPAPQPVDAGTLEMHVSVRVLFDETLVEDGRITLPELHAIISSESPDALVIVIPTGGVEADLPITSEPSDTIPAPAEPVIHILARSDRPFSEAGLEVTVSIDISDLSDQFLNLFAEIDATFDTALAAQVLHTPLPAINSSALTLLNLERGFEPGDTLSQAAEEYFTLHQIFNREVSTLFPAIGALPDINLPNFDISDAGHRLKLRHVMEERFGLSLGPDWDLSLYLLEIWSLISPDFQIDSYLPQLQLLLALPVVPAVNEIRSEVRSRFGTYPSLEGLVDYIRATRLKPMINGFSSEHATDPFEFSGQYDVKSKGIRFDLEMDAARPVDVPVDLTGLLADSGVALDGQLSVTLTIGLMVDASAGVTGGEGWLQVQEAAVTVREQELIEDIGVTREDAPRGPPMMAEGRFDLDSRVECIFHGLDPPVPTSRFAAEDLIVEASGILDITFPFASNPSLSPASHLRISSENIFNPEATVVSVSADAAAMLSGGSWAVHDDLIVEPDETLSGNGVINGDLTLGGILSPGNSPGLTQINGDTTFDGTLEIEIGGSGGPGAADGHDQIIVSGTANFGGKLNLSLIDKFVPEVGQQFEIITYTSAVGDFATFTGMDIGVGGYFNPVKGANGYTLQVVGRVNYLLPGNPETTGGLPNKADPNNYLVQRPQYTLSYNDSTKGPNWVAWQLNAQWFAGNVADNRSSFRPDPALDSAWNNNTGDSYYSGVSYAGYAETFARGHMAPNADMKAARTDNLATYYMSNILPQWQNKNNSGVWSSLERFSRKLVTEFNHELYIIAGGYGTLTDPGGADVTFTRTGTDGTDVTVTAPERLWKVIFILDQPGQALNTVGGLDANGKQTRVIAVDFPNGPVNAKWYDSPYLVDVDTLETRTGYDFLSNPALDGIEADIEGTAYEGDVKLIDPDAINPGGRGPGVEEVATLDMTVDSTLVIEIGGPTPLVLNDPPPPDPDDHYDQLRVTDAATLDGTLQILQWNNYVPTAGERYEILTFGSVDFDAAERPFGFKNFLGTTIGSISLVPILEAGKYILEAVETTELTNAASGQLKDGSGITKGAFDAIQKAVQYAIALPFVKQSDASVGSLSKLGEAGQAILVDPIDNLIPDPNAVVQPFQTQITQVLEDLDQTEVLGFTISVHSVLGTYGAEPSYRLSLTASRTEVIRLDAGAEPLLGLSFPDAEIVVEAAIDLDITFGIDAGGNFFLDVHEVLARVSLDVTGLGFAADFAEIGAALEVEDGTMHLDAAVGFSTAGPVTDAILEEVANETRPVTDVFTFVAPAGTLAASMNLNAVLSGFEDFSLDGSATIEVRSDDVFSGSPPEIRVEVDGSLTVYGQTLEGLFIFERIGSGQNAQTLIHATIRNLELTAGGERVARFDGSGDLLVTSDGLAGQLTVNLLEGPAINGLDISGTATLQINTTGTDVTEIGGQPVELTLPSPGVSFFRVSVAGELVAFGQTLQGTFVLEVIEGDDAVIGVAAQITLLELAAGGVRVVQLSGNGAMLITSTGIAAQFSVTLLQGPEIPGVEDITGTATLQINTTGTDVTEIAGQPVELMLPSPGVSFFRVSVVGDLVAFGQTLQGTFVLEVIEGDDAVIGVAAQITLLELAAGGVRVVQLSGSGAMLITSTGIAAQFSVNLLQGPEIPGVEALTGTATLQINTTGTDVTEIAGQAVQLTPPSPGVSFFRVSIDGELVAFGQTLQGTFVLEVIEGDNAVIGVAAQITLLELAADGVRVVQLSGSGAMLITSTGIAAQFSVTLLQGPEIPGVEALTGTATLQINTTGTDVTEIAGQAVQLTPPSPGVSFFRVSIAGELVAFGQTLQGTFVLEVIEGDDAVIGVAAQITLLELAAGGVRVVQLSGSGAMLITSTGIAAHFSVNLDLGPAIPSLESLTGTATLQINTTGEEVLEIAGQPVQLTPPSPGVSFFRVSVDGELVAFGQTLQGTFVLEVIEGDDAVIGVAAQITLLELAAGGVRVVQLSGSGAMLITSTGIAAQFSVTLVQGPEIPGVEALTGTATLQINTTGTDVTEIAGQPVQLTLPSPGVSFFRVSVTGDLTVLDQVLSGTFTLQVISGDATQIILDADFTLSLTAGGTQIAVFSGEGQLTIESDGMFGNFTVSLDSGPVIAGMDLTGTSVTLNFDTRPPTPFAQITVEGELTFSGGQSLRGIFDLRAETTADGDAVVTVQVSNATIDFSDTATAVTVETVNGTFIFTSDGFFGSASASVNVSHATVAFSGAFEVSLNTTASPQEEEVDLGAGEQEIAVPAGPFVRVSAEGASLTYTPVGGSAQELTGNFSLEASTAAGSPVVVVTAYEVGMTLRADGTPVVQVTNGSGAFIITADGIAGSLSATVGITESFSDAVEASSGARFSLEGRFRLDLNSTASAVDLESTIGTNTIPVNLPAGPFIRIAGDDVVVRLMDEALSGNFAIEARPDEVRLSASNVSITVSAGTARLTATGGAGTLVIDGAGVAGKAKFDSLVLSGVPGVAASVTDLDIELRTMSGPDVILTIDSDGDGVDEAVTLPGPDPYFEISAAMSLTVLGQEFSGDLGLRVVDEGGNRVITIDARNLNVPVVIGGTTLMTLEGGGTLRIADDGVAGFGTLDVPGGIDISGLPLAITSATVAFEFNSTGEEVRVTPVTAGVPADLAAGEYVKLKIAGGLRIGESFTVTGSFVATLEASTVTIELYSLGLGEFTLSGEDPLLTIRIFDSGEGVDYEITVGYSLIVSGLESIVTFLRNSLADNAYYTRPIPVINRSLSQALDFIDDFEARIAAAGRETPDALDAIERVIEDALGLPDDGLELSFDIDALAFVVEVEWSKLFSEDFNFSFDLASLATMAGVDLSLLGDIDSLNDRLGAGTSGNLNLAAQVTVGAAVEISLLPLADGNSPTTTLRRYDSQNDSGTRLQLGARVLGKDLELGFNIGPIALGVVDGSVAFDGDGNADTADDLATFTVGFNQDYELGSGNIVDNLGFDLAGRMNVNLPLGLVYDGGVLPLDAFRVSTNPIYGDQGLTELYKFIVGDGTTGGHDPVVIHFPDVVGIFESLFGEFSLLGLLNDPSFVLDGIDLVLGSLGEMLDDGLGSDLPLVGDKLAGMADFITSIRSGILLDLRKKFSTTSPVEIVRDVLWDVLGPAGLNIILDANGDPATDKSAISINWYDADGVFIHEWRPGQLVPIEGQLKQLDGVENEVYAKGADALQFDMSLGGELLSAGIDIPVDFNLPGFGLDIDGGVGVILAWYFPASVSASATDST